jgi:hypothetical protein
MEPKLMHKVLFEEGEIKVIQTDQISWPEDTLLRNLAAAQKVYLRPDGTGATDALHIVLLALGQFVNRASPGSNLALLDDLRRAAFDRSCGIAEPLLNARQSGAAANSMPTNTVLFRARVVGAVSFLMTDGGQARDAAGRFVAEACARAGFLSRKGSPIKHISILTARDELLSRPAVQDQQPSAEISDQRYCIHVFESVRDHSARREHDEVLETLRSANAERPIEIVHNFIAAERKLKTSKLW